VTFVGLAIRWVHLASGIILTGAFLFAFLVGNRGSVTIQAWDRRVMDWTRWTVGVLLVSGLAVLSYQAVVVTGKPAEGLNRESFLPP